MDKSKPRAWLTPDSEEALADLICRRFFIPDAPGLRESVSGALLELTYEWNWEQFGTMTPAEAASIMLEMYNRYALDTACSNEVPAPYWEADEDNESGQQDALSQSWYGVVTSEVWYEQLADWTIAGFLAIAATPAAAITYLTYVPRFRLALRTHDIGSAVKIFLDGTEIFAGDTYSASPGVMEVDVFADDLSPDTSPHNIIIMQDSASSLQVIRKRLDPNELYPTNMRYDSTSGAIQTTYDGGTTWVDTPNSDPRYGVVFLRPPRGTGDVSCDAAANMVAWIRGFIDQCITYLNIGAAVGTVINGLLTLFDLLSGGWAILVQAIIDLFSTMAFVTASVLTAIFTDGFYADLLCYFYDNMDASGAVDAAQLSAIMDAISVGYAGNVTTVMDGILSVQGYIGLTNAGAIGAEVGDCAACACDLYIDFTDGALYTFYVRTAGVALSTLDSAFGNPSPSAKSGSGYHAGVPAFSVDVQIVLDAAQDITDVSFDYYYNRSDGGGIYIYAQFIDSGGGTISTDTLTLGGTMDSWQHVSLIGAAGVKTIKLGCGGEAYGLTATGWLDNICVRW